MKRFHPLLPGLALAAGLLILVFIRHPDSSTSHDRDAKDETVDRAAPATTQKKSAPKARLTSAESGRLRRPLTGLSDLQLPPRLDLRWDAPVQEPVFEEFRRWTENWLAAGAKAGLEPGIELAQQRRQELLDLIDKDPRRALELAVPESVRRQLPAGIAALLEERVDARGDLLVQATTSQDGGCQITRTATLQDGRVFDAHTYGRRGAMPTRDNIAVHGVAIDGKLALSDLPGRVLEPIEVAAMQSSGAVLESCPDLTGSAHPIEASDEIVIAWDDQRMTRCCGEAHAVAALIFVEGEEQSAEPATMESDLDGVIAASPWTEGQKTLLIIRVDFPDYQGERVSDATLEQLIADMNTVYTEMSSGKASYALAGQGSDFTPTVRMPNNSSAYASHTKLSKVLTDARAAAAAAGFNYLNYTHEVVVTGSTPVVPFTAGMANVGARGAWVHNAQWNLKTVGHEVGHNFGLPHAGAWDTDDGSVIGPGDVWSYGNNFDLMGVGNASALLRHFGAVFKEYLDWIPTSDVVKVTTNGSTTTRIRAMDKVQADGNLRALAVDRAGSTDDYWVEYRQLFGTNFGLRDGVLVNWANINGGYQQPLLLDMNPDTYQKDDAVLPIGMTFSDTAAGIHITPVGRGTDPDGVAWMDVTVNRGSFPGNGKPTATLSSSNPNPAVNASVTFTATASDPNGDALAYHWDWGDGTTTTNNSPTASKSWSTVGIKTVSCIVSDMKGGSTTAALVVQVGISSTFFIQGVVTTTQGDPVKGVVVRAAPGKTDTTDSEGLYVITELDAGSYTLTATKTGLSILPDNFSNPVTVGPSQQGKDFVVPPGAPAFTAAMKPALTDQGSTTGAIPLPLADADTDIALLTLSATSSDQGIIPDSNITFGNIGTTRTIIVSAASTVSGTVDITITATDPEGASGSYVWPVTVNAKPVLSISAPTTTENTPVDIDLRTFVSDDITPDELLFFDVDRVRNGTMTLLPDGYTARFTPDAKFNGSANFRLVVRDQSLGPNFRFFYDFEPPDTHEDALTTDQSNFNRTGSLQAVNGGTYGYDASVPTVLSPQSVNSLVFAQNGDNGARLRRTMTATDHNLNNSDWTFSAWVRRGGTDTEDFVFYLGDGDGHGAHDELELFFSAGNDTLKLQKWGAGGLEKEIVCPGLPSGQWHHITLSYDRISTGSGTFYLYVDKFLRGSVEGVTMNVNQDAPVVVGGHSSSTFAVDRWFDGVMDEVLFQSGLSSRGEINNRSRMGARHHHGLSASSGVTISVTGSNQPPSIVAVPDLFVPANAVNSPVTVRLSDGETEARNLSLTAVSSNQSLLPNGSITVGAAPPAWTSDDVGNVTTSSYLTEDFGTLLVGGAGAGIGPAGGDAFRWVRQSFTGDAEVIARVVSVDHSNPSAEAGLMMRESTSATSRFAYVRVTASEGVSFLHRATGSAEAVVTATLPLASTPCWLRLVREGSGYTAFYATDNDGTAGAWQPVGTAQTISFSGSAHDIGMAVSSHVDTTVCTAVFDRLGGTVQTGGERTLLLTPMAGQTGSTTITLTASDGAQSSQASFEVQVVGGAPPSTTNWNAVATSGTLHWSTGAHWTGGVPPPSSRFSTIEFFNGQTLPSGTITSNIDTSGGHELSVLTLGGTGPASGTTTMSLGGNALIFRRESLLDPVVNLAATNGSGLTWNISAPVTMEDHVTFKGSGTAAFVFSGEIGGSANLIKSGASTLILTGANTYAGTTTINGGILQIGNDGANGSLPSGAVVNNATLRFDRTGTLLVPNAISGSGGITLDCPINAGTVVLSGNNSFTGDVTVNSGALRITNSSALGTALPEKTIFLTNGTAGSPQLLLDGSGGAIDLPAAISYRTSVPNGAIVNEAGDNILRGDIMLMSGGGDTRIVASGGSLRLTGSIQSGVSSQRAFILAGTGNGQVEGVISDNPSGGVVVVRKLESGTWTLTGANTYTGNTTLNAGTLRINAPGSLSASSAVTVNAATLAGDGTVGGSVTLAAAGRISPGVAEGSAGTLSIGGGLNVFSMATGNGKLFLNLRSPTSSDQIAVGGTLTMGTGVLGFDDFVFTGLSGLTSGTYKLITSTAISGTLDPTNLTGMIGSFNATLGINGNDLELMLTHPFTTWQSINSASGTITGDHDNDGVPDGIEYFLGGPNGNTTGQTHLPGILNDGGTLSITWTMGPGYTGTYGTDFTIETSETLTGMWTTETVGARVIINGSSVTYTFPGPPATGTFVRLKVRMP